MSFREKANDWIKENVPTLSKVYENKYVSMVYDRYASLPPNQQKTLTGVMVGSIVLFIVGYLFTAYLSLWSKASEINNASRMVQMIRDHEKNSSKKGGELGLLEKSNRLASQGALKQHLIAQGRLANISPRLLQVEEKEGRVDDGKGSGGLKAKEANVTLSRINLNQLRNYLENIEFGIYNLSVSSINIKNDDQLRGYMNVELGVVAYLFQNAGGAQ